MIVHSSIKTNARLFYPLKNKSHASTAETRVIFFVLFSSTVLGGQQESMHAVWVSLQVPLSCC